jgi:hypothetical protein
MLRERAHIQQRRPLHAPGLPHHQPPPGSLRLPLPYPVLARSCFRGCLVIRPLVPSYVRRSAQQAGSAVRTRDRDKLQEYLRDHNRPGHTFRLIAFESSGRFSEGAMTSIREVAHGAFPEAQAARARESCFSNLFSHLAVVRCRHTSCMLTAAAGLQTAHAGSGWLQGSHYPAADIHS